MAVSRAMLPRKIFPAVALMLLVLQPWGCEKSPTTSTNPTPAGITAAFNPTSAGADTAVGFTITISANTKEIRSFGGEVIFDASMFSFQGVAKGSLTESWALIDGNESSPGTVRLGGSVGGGTAVAVNSKGTLVEVRFKVTGGSYGNGQTNRVCLAQFTDDLAQFTSGEACAVFTLKK
jgi:hypothetical protein